MNKIIKWLLVVIVLLAAVVACWYWLKPKPQVNYITETVSRGDISQTVSATGEISAAQLVNVGAQATGQINKLYVKVGQKVKKGDLIAEIDATTQINNLNTTKAKLETFKAQLHSAEVALQAAQLKYKREKALWAENATSKEELENAQTALASAKANIGELKSNIKQTQISINTAEADLGHTRIVSPMDGTIVSMPTEAGQTVNSVQSSPTIVQVADLSHMLNKMQIAEGDINKVKVGQKLVFTTLSAPDRQREAVLESIDPGLTTMSQGSYSTSTDTTSTAIYYYARTMVPNEDGSLYIGMTTENTITINEAKNVLTVPTLAIKQVKGKKVVRVLTAEKQPEERVVETGLSDGTSTEIKSGLKAGEAVIVSESQEGDLGDSAGRTRRPPM